MNRIDTHDFYGDLDSREQVEILVKNFYADVAQDTLLGHIFNDVAHVDWSVHLPKLVDFWCRNLFAQPGYVGNPLHEHQKVHGQESFTEAHFIRWLELFQENIDMHWEGPYCDLIKKKAVYIGAVHYKALTGNTLNLMIPISRKPQS